MTLIQTLSILVFILVFVLIATEAIHKMYAAILGAFGMVMIGAVRPYELLYFIEIEILAVVFGLFLLVRGAERSGLFQLLAVKIMRSSRSPTAFAVILMAFTVFLAVFVSNIGAMLVMASMTVTMARSLKIKPQTLMIFQSIVTNIGGMMLLTSSIPNIIIALEGDLSFQSFAANILPLGIILYFVTLLIFVKIIASEFVTGPETEFRDLEFHEWVEQAIEISGVKDSGIGKEQIMSALVMVVTILGFILSDFLGLSSPFVALVGGCLMLMTQCREPSRVLGEIDWATLLFLAGIFIMVNGMDRIGVVELMSEGIANLIGEEPFKASIVIMWLSGVTSSLVDNIPLSSSLAPIVKDLVVNEGWKSLWWALVIGVNLGGSLTPIGSPSTIIAFGVSEQEGYPIAFKRFLKIGMGLTVLYYLISMSYLYIKYSIF